MKRIVRKTGWVVSAVVCLIAIVHADEVKQDNPNDPPALAEIAQNGTNALVRIAAIEQTNAMMVGNKNWSGAGPRHRAAGGRRLSCLCVRK